MAHSHSPATYKALFHRVKKTLILGQQKIEAEKVKIYWETGHLIHTHIKKQGKRAAYGMQVVKQLAQDLQMEQTVLHRCVRFAKNIPAPKLLPRGNNSAGAITAS